MKAREALDEVSDNAFPHLVRESGVVTWESRFFGFVKDGLAIEERREQLQTRMNSRVGMRVSDVKSLALAFTGKEPSVIRNAFFDGWTLGESALDVDTVFSGEDTGDSRQTYYVIFSEPIPTELLTRLDNELTKIEKAGSKHYITAPPALWILGDSSIGNDSTLG